MPVFALSARAIARHSLIRLLRGRAAHRSVTTHSPLAAPLAASALLLSAGAWAMIEPGSAPVSAGAASAALRVSAQLQPAGGSSLDACAHGSGLPTGLSLPIEADATAIPLRRISNRRLASAAHGRHSSHDKRSGKASSKTELASRGPQTPPLAMPVSGARMTSGFGWRIHPILNVRLFHKGVDFAAPEGTPVSAAQDGVVEEAGWHGQYGYYVLVKHARGLETAYAHLASIAPGIHAGSVVKRHEVIAAVGETGLATGPHLYYEVILNGKRINPLARTTAEAVRVAEHRSLHGGSASEG